MYCSLRTALTIIIVGIILITPSGASSAPDRAAPSGVTVARVYYADRTQLADLTIRYDVWEVHAKEGFVVAALTADEYQVLLTQGYRLQIEMALTAELNRPHTYLPGQTNGIPGYPCYRTVEETYTTAQNIVAAHSDLAQWIDIGDSWDKIIAGGIPGYDLMVLKLTNQAIPGPKPKLFIMSAIHAREYTTAEANTRFAEYLVNNYGVDPDATWLLDYNEIHLLLQSNPDGRKLAEAGDLWRKNVNNNYCANTTSRGADLNRNYPFHWGGPGASTSQCEETFRGSGAASEPETQAVINYVRSQYPDLRIDDLTSAAPITTSGVFIDLHSYSQLVLWPWGDTTQVAPNGPAMQTLGRKFAYFNDYTPQQSVGLYPTSGTTDDTAYGELGVPAFTIEMGTNFFESCASFESTTYPENFPALLYAARATRRPYQTPAGPDVINLTVTPTTTAALPVTLTATANDTRFNNSNGAEPAQAITAARYSIDAPSWLNATTYPLSANDGSFNATIEAITGQINTVCLAPGRHMVFVEAQDAAGNWGVPGAVFIDGTPAAVQGGLPQLTPIQQTGAGLAGRSVTYPIGVKNIGAYTDSFTLTIMSNQWLVTLGVTQTQLMPNELLTVPLTVTIPLTAPIGGMDSVSITASGLQCGASATVWTNLVYGVYLPMAIGGE